MAKPDKKKEALALLARNIPQTRVAEMIGINRRTLVRWLNDADFRKELNENRRDHLENVLDKVIDNSSISVQNTQEISQVDTLIGKAIAALNDILSCPESRNTDRIRASELVLKLLAADRVQAFSGGNSGGKSSGIPIPVEEGLDRSGEIERLLERREQLKNRIAVLKNQ